MILAAFGSLIFAASAQANTEYDCGSHDGIGIRATYFEEEDVVGADVTQLATGQQRRLILQPAVSGSGIRYADPGSGVEFIEHQGQAFFIAEGVQLSCRVVATSTPGGGTIGVPVQSFAGFSFGGNLRAGPGVQFQDVGSLPEGTPVTLIEDSGQFFNGFSFWLIQMPNGQQAYHWGGILCAPGFDLPGVFNDGC